VESDPGARDVVHDIVLADGEVVEILGANAYVQEGPLTTFFHFAGSSGAVPRPFGPFPPTETNGPSVDTAG